MTAMNNPPEAVAAGLKTISQRTCAPHVATFLVIAVLMSTADGNTVANNDCESEEHPFISGGQTGVDGVSVRALTVWNGDLFVDGEFTTARGQTVNRIARWGGDDSEDCPDSIVCINANGDVTVGSGATLTMKIAGFEPCVDHDAIFAGGDVILEGGGLTVVLDCDFAPQAGDTVAIISAEGTVNGSFSEITVPDLDDSLKFCIEVGLKNVLVRTTNITDLNCDGVVDVSDLLILLSNWGTCPPDGECIGDINEDGTVDVSDLLILLSNWG